MTVYLVGAGPGDPGLLTRRGAALLVEAEVVIHDRLVHPALLTLASPSAQRIDVGKRPDTAGDGGARQDEINRLLIEHGRRGQLVVRLKGGDPFLFGRGGEEVEALTRAGVPWEVVPGVTSAFGVPAAAGIPVTHRGLSTTVTVVTGRVGDPSAPGGVDWPTLAHLDGTLVILMGMKNRAEIAAALQKGGKAGGTPVAVVEQGTTAAQKIVRTTLDGLADVELGSPAVIVVGPVAALGAAQMPPVVAGPLAGRTVVVTRSGRRARGLAEALHQAGAATIEMPLTTQTEAADGGTSLRAAAADVAQYAWVVFTSVNAVTRFMGAVRDARSLGSVEVAAVGPATGDALRAAGVEPDLVPAEQRARGLVDAFPECEGPSSGRVLFPCAEQAPPTIPDGLGLKGWAVERVETYRTVARPAPDPDTLAVAARADAVTFAASSAVTAYLALRAPGGGSLPVPPLVVCIGPTTAATARRLGLRGVHEAHGPSAEGIVAALVHHRDDGQSDGS